MLNFGQECVPTRCVNTTAAGTGDVDGSVIDMAGFDAVAFVALLGDVVTGSVVSLEVRESDAANGSGSTLVAGSKTADFTGDATSADNGVLISDVVRPQKRYLFPRVHRATANAPIDSVMAHRYRPRTLPVVQPANTVLASVISTPEV